MFESITGFFKLIDVDMVWPILIVGLSFVRCMVPNSLVSKIKEVKKEDGTKEYHIYKIKD